MGIWVKAVVNLNIAGALCAAIQHLWDLSAAGDDRWKTAGIMAFSAYNDLYLLSTRGRPLKLCHGDTCQFPGTESVPPVAITGNGLRGEMFSIPLRGTVEPETNITLVSATLRLHVYQQFAHRLFGGVSLPYVCRVF